MNIIVNTDKNWAIGRDNQLLFHLSQDMKFFKTHTQNNTVVMGRKTLDSLPGGKALPNRRNIVLTGNKNFERENVTVCNSVEEIVELIKDIPSESIYIIGGQSLYSEFLPFCDTAYVTKVESSAENADAFMVNLDEHSDWEVFEESETYTEKGYDFKFVTYKKIQ